MKSKRFWFGMVFVALIFGGSLISCATARQTIPMTAVTLQRVRTTIMPDLPMQIFVDNVPYELANGETKTITINNGEHLVYAVLGDVESKSSRFTARSRTVVINATPKGTLLGLGSIFDSYNLDIEVLEH
ncbi:MAG: hypothetical protein LBG94_06890 [Treponema sp.]|nr:hypothetical protein [Treponema sp.]